MEEGVALCVSIQVVQVVIPGRVVLDTGRIFHGDLVIVHIQRMTDSNAYHVPSESDHSDNQCRHYNVLSVGPL